MKASSIYLSSIIIFCFAANVFAQKDDTKPKKDTQQNDRKVQDEFSKRILNEDALTKNKQDYSVVNSNNAFIEIEFTPAFFSESKINSNGKEFTYINFLNGFPSNVNNFGDIDLKSRSFAVIVPSNINNSVTITDIQTEDVYNMELSPIPTIKYNDPNKPGFDNIDWIFTKDQSKYSQNKFLPENPAYLTDVGQVRHLTMGTLAVHGYQYNPVTKVLRKIKSIRVRVNFGQAPVYLTRKLSYAENDLLNGIALNSNIALYWNTPSSNQNSSSILTSAMSTGAWYKIEIKDIGGNGSSDGMYKLTKSFLESSGMNLSGVDPRKIKMYGYGGERLPRDQSVTRPVDMQELPIFIEGEQDGSFDANDHVLFYGRSVNNWVYDTTENRYRHTLNFQTISNYYWIRIPVANDGNGTRMALVPSENSNNPIVPASFTEKIFYEPEIQNLILEGDLWLSHTVSTGGQFVWNNTLTGLESGSEIFYRIKPAARLVCDPCPYSHQFFLKEDRSNMSEITLPMNTVQPGFGDWIYTTETSFTLNSNQLTGGEQSSLRATYSATTGDAQGYLDYFEIQYKRRLNSAVSDVLKFDSPDVNGIVEYNVSSFSNNNIKVFDATEHSNVKIIQPLSVSSSNVRFQKTQVTDNLSKFFVVGQNGFKTPVQGAISSRIANQNLHGSYNDGADFIIITHSSLNAAANRLKQKREAPGVGHPNYLKTYVFNVDQIYNEFSSGVLDVVAIRDFIKYVYENWTIKPAYVCLLGDGDFDYKNILQNDENWVPAYEVTDPQINQVNGYCTDDFYVDIAGPDIRPDIAIGRIPARGLDEANGYMDKIDCYESPSSNAYWKNKMLFVADDGKTNAGNEGDVHQNQCEELAETKVPPFIEKEKIYIVHYPTVITSQGRRKPTSNTDIIKKWNAGCLNIHYTGHGSPDVWAHEYILEKDVIMSQLNNECKYPFVSIASCDMSKFDNPISQSAGEIFMITAKKGAIGTLAATRPVYGQLNHALMLLLFNFTYLPRETLLYPVRYGTGLFQAKQNIAYTPNEMKYVLLCDPTVRNQQGHYRSRVDSIAGLSSDTMRALSRIKVYGTFLNPDSTVWTGFNGKIIIKLFDQPRTISVYDGEYPLPYVSKINGGIIFSGTQNVVNGQWKVEFIVPRDISYLNKRGRLINYVFNTTQTSGVGVDSNFIVGGIDPNAAIDSAGPQITLFMNSRNFRTGDVVNTNAKLIADLFDESGINTTGTIGHKIEAVIDNNESQKYDLTNFYNSDTSYKYGSLEYDLNNLSEGRHNLRLRAWDTYNNSSENQVDFVVSSSSVMQVMNVFNYPNPFSDKTSFTFQHNYPDAIDVKIKVYTVAGRLIYEIEKNNINDKFVVLDWQGTDQDGEKLGNGIYIYKLTVKSKDGASVTNTGKLAVLK